MDPTPREPDMRVRWTAYRIVLGIALVLFVGAVTSRPIPEVDPDEDGEARYQLFVPYVPNDIDVALRSSLENAAAVMMALPNGQSSLGSAFVVQDGMVGTAAHVVSGADGLPITVYCDGKEVEGTPIAIDEARDIALISADCRNAGGAVRWSLDEPDVDKTLYMAGFTFLTDDDGGVPSNTLVAVQYIEQTSYIPNARLERHLEDAAIDPAVKRVIEGMAREHATPLMAVAGRMKPGHSGSAVYDETGALVGMAIIIDGSRNRSFIVPAKSIMEVVRTVSAN